MFNQIDAAKVHKTFQIASINYILKCIFYTNQHKIDNINLAIRTIPQLLKKQKRRKKYPNLEL